MGAPTHETARHVDAFELWWNGGEPLSFQEVSRRLSVSSQSVKTWARTFGWRERAAQRLQDASQQADEAAIADLAQTLTELRNDARELRVHIMDSLKSNDVKFTAADADRIARLELFVQGQPDSREEIITEAMLDREIARLELELGITPGGSS